MTQDTEREIRDERETTNRLAREFWERVVVESCHDTQLTVSDTVSWADFALAEWRKRFAPKERP